MIPNEIVFKYILSVMADEYNDLCDYNSVLI